MAIYKFDPKKNPPASGSRQDYIKPGTYKLKIISYKDDDSNSGNPMHTFQFQIINGDEKGKKLTDWFTMPKKRGDSDFGIRRLNALIVAVARPKDDKPRDLDLAKLKNKEFVAEIGDVRQEASKGADGRDYPARTVSRVAEYVDPRGQETDDDEDEDEDSADDEDDEEEEEPSPRARRGRPAKAATATKAKAKATAKAPAKRRASRDEDENEDDEDEDDDDFPFDDDEDEDDDD